MLFQNLLLIIRQLQPSVDFAVRDQQEIILRYRKENGGNALPKIGQNRHSLFLHARHSPIPSATVHVSSATVPSLLFATVHVSSATVHVSSATVHVSFADVPPPLKKKSSFYFALKQFFTIFATHFDTRRSHNSRHRCARDTALNEEAHSMARL